MRNPAADVSRETIETRGGIRMDFESLFGALIGIGLVLGAICSGATGLVIPYAERLLTRSLPENERRIISLAVPFAVVLAVLVIDALTSGAPPTPLYTGSAVLVAFIAATGKQGAYAVYELARVIAAVRTGQTTPPANWRGAEAGPAETPPGAVPAAFAAEGPGPRIQAYPAEPGAPGDPRPLAPRGYPGSPPPIPPPPAPPAPPALADLPVPPVLPEEPGSTQH
jgi:hypothetical protein